MPAFALAVLLTVPLLAGDQAIDELVTQAKENVRDYSLTPPDSIGGVVEHEVSNVANGRQLVAIVHDRFGLKEETARLITIAVLRSVVTEVRSGTETDEEYEEQAQAVERDYSDALRSDPSNLAVAREYLALIGDTLVERFPNAANTVADVLRGLPRDKRAFVALQVLSDLRVHRGDPALFEAVSQSYGLDPFALAIAGDDLSSSASAEIFDRAAALWLAQKDVPSAAAAAARAMYAYGNRRSAADVMRIYRSLPAEAKAIVSSAPAAEATVRSHGLERRIRMLDVRFTLAAAFIISSDARAALPLLPVSHAKQDDPEAQARWAVAATLRAANDPPGGDAFDLVTSYLQRADQKTTALVDEVFDRVATRAGYAAASKWRLEKVTRADEQLAGMERALLPPSVAALVPACVMPADDATSPAVARLLDRASLASFVERPVDDSARVSELDPRYESADGGPVLPEFTAVRVEVRGNEIVALATSQDVDPAGEISAGGYWIVRSTDGGVTWKPPLYTGLRVMEPYEVVIGSTLPMLRDDGLRLEVTVNELDQDSITFPPVALRAKRTREGITIDLKWRDLERDSDGDGLTDLVEERILTDPNSADTDGDGLPDGIDPLPQVAFRESAGPAAEIVATALGAYYSQGAPAKLGTRTIFIAGNPADFAGVRSRLRRLIVVSEADIEAASKKFGPTLAMHISPVIIDQLGTRAWVQMNDQWRGATYLLTKRDGVWTALVVGAWVT
jgi:hypothetical protein